MIDTLRLLMKSPSGRWGFLWCVIALAPAMVSLSVALSVQSALDQQAWVRFQRDTAQGLSPTVSRSSFTRPIAESDDRPVQIVTVSALSGEALEWPGLENTLEPGSILASAAVLELDREHIVALSGHPRPGLLPDGLESYPGEFVVLRFVDSAEALPGGTPLASGFDEPFRGQSSPLTLRLVAASAVVLPAFALARASAVLFVSRNRSTIAMVRLFGVSSHSAAGAVAASVAGASLAAVLVATGLLAALRRTGWIVRLDSVAVSTVQLNLHRAEILVICMAGAGVALGAALLASRSLIDDPLGSVRRSKPVDQHGPTGALMLSAVAVAAVLAYTRLRDYLPDAIAVLSLLAILVGLATTSSRLALELAVAFSRMANRGPTGAITTAVTSRLASEFRVLLVPLGWGTLLAGLVLGILPAVDGVASGTDLRFVLTSPEVPIIDHVAGVASAREEKQAIAAADDGAHEGGDGSVLLVELDWTVPPSDVVNSVRDLAPVAIVESPRNQELAASFEFERVRAALLLALVTGLSLTSVAYVAGIANVIGRVQPRFTALRLFGVRRSRCIAAGTRAVFSPLLFVLMLPLFGGILSAQALRDDASSAWMVTPGWPVTMATLAAVVLVLAIVVGPLGQLEPSTSRNAD